MWSRIAKAVDNAEAEAPGGVEAYQVEHIINAILECALPKPRLDDKISKEGPKPRNKKITQQTSHAPALDTTTGHPKKQESWAVVASQNKGNALSKPSLTQPLRGTRPDARLMVRLGPESPHREEHPFVLLSPQHSGWESSASKIFYTTPNASNTTTSTNYRILACDSFLHLKYNIGVSPIHPPTFSSHFHFSITSYPFSKPESIKPNLTINQPIFISHPHQRIIFTVSFFLKKNKNKKKPPPRNEREGETKRRSGIVYCNSKKTC